MKYYKPYDTHYSTQQTLLLELWDKIGLSYDCLKQEFGKVLTIIGSEVDPNAMSFTMFKAA